MNPSVFCTALLKVYEYVSKPDHLFLCTNEEIISHLKLLEYATLIGSSSIPPKVQNFFDSGITEKQSNWIKDLRETEIISSLPLYQERYVYRSLTRILSK